jgi:hypothetical protein
LFPAIKAVRVSKSTSTAICSIPTREYISGIGYNNLLQKKDAKANTYFDQALERIKKKKKEVYE